eukprot:TRINITY_DN16689_c0_g2_i2.p1 TRINITY_DN16689_c0_g2~~TRINITY_DN16689_c0_g2_i2.p1  ORF type:complete len:293 (-),score=34.48 TRINITY_DN16689_c0_g2_i2:115-918(-)
MAYLVALTAFFAAKIDAVRAGTRSDVDALHSEAAGAEGQRVYTVNKMCLTRHCLNPIFPAMQRYHENVFSTNLQRKWGCVSNHEAWKSTRFCGRVISAYPIALPLEGDAISNNVSQETSYLLQQDREAINAYVAHLSGMGLDFWSYTKPWEADECIASVWRLACYTHFPRCNVLQSGKYLKPCKSSCQSYISACMVECCDEGVKCNFAHKKMFADGTMSLEEGFDTHDGPSPYCTGSAIPLAGRPFSVILLLVQLLVAPGVSWTLMS